jgi:hypothetical protein
MKKTGKTRIEKPVFDKDGYQTNIRDLNGEPLPDPSKVKWLTLAQQTALGIPAPEELAKLMKLERVTINLEAQDVRFFKQQAAKNRVPYQGLIREVLSHYVHARKAA